MITSESLKFICKAKKRPSILVIGDIMADRYVWGSTTRISPEAPVPVVSVRDETISLGGAANVAQNLCKLDAHVSLCGIVGSDAYGPDIQKLLKKEKIENDLVIKDNSRITTVKTRVMAGNHQLLRIDREITKNIDTGIEDVLISKISKKIDTTDIIMLSDYNKGLLTENFTHRLITICNSKNKKVIVDPKGLHYEKYKGAWLIKPNKRELAEATANEKIETPDSLIKAGRKLITKTKSQYLVVTLSEEGLALISKKTDQHFPVKAREVFDVTGAGDTVFACLGYFVAVGLDLTTACELANYAAAIAVSKVGSVAVTTQDIINLIKAHE